MHQSLYFLCARSKFISLNKKPKSSFVFQSAPCIAKNSPPALGRCNRHKKLKRSMTRSRARYLFSVEDCVHRSPWTNTRYSVSKTKCRQKKYWSKRFRLTPRCLPKNSVAKTQDINRPMFGAMAEKMVLDILGKPDNVRPIRPRQNHRVHEKEVWCYRTDSRKQSASSPVSAATLSSRALRISQSGMMRRNRS